MSNRRYTEEFKAEAVKQVNDRGYGAQELSERLGISLKSMYAWLGEARANKGTKASDDLSREVAGLKAELKRVEEERDILIKAAAYFAKRIPVRYAFIRDHTEEFRVVSMCRVLKVNRSGYYVWLKEAESARQKEDRRIIEMIREFHEESACSYASSRITRDLREAAERCNLKRVARLMMQKGLRAKVGYKKPRYKAACLRLRLLTS